jgi:methionyl-tRNA synthetase
MSAEHFYVTTPIYYVNDRPHLGHAYTTLLADVLARFARLRGADTFFLTGTDEHGQKVEEAARHHGVSPALHADTLVRHYLEAWQHLHIRYDDFIRTTEARHVRVVRAALHQLWKQGDIYLGRYEGWYCVADERFWTEKDLVDGSCPDCGRAVRRLEEPNYFFRMNHYQEWLLDYLATHPTFIQPDYRRNEVLGFLRRPLEDLCISRPASRLSWGIPLPFDESYVTYVWFDALLNYLTGAGYLDDPARFSILWPRVHHLIGKDILITHAVYWPTMLAALGLPLPCQILAHGWWIAGDTKMSKSRGNIVRPLQLADKYGVDAFRYFLLRDMALGKDANFNEETLRQRYQADLANDFGNLLQRLESLIARTFAGTLPAPGASGPDEEILQAQCRALLRNVQEQVKAMAVNEALVSIFDVIAATNRYLEQTSPWKLDMGRDRARLETILYTACEALRVSSLCLWPVLPRKMEEVWARLGWIPETGFDEAGRWGLLEPGATLSPGDPLFPRLA